MRFLLFFLFLPFLAAIGHDLYVNYYLDEDKLRDLKNLRPEFDNFLISDLGWVWNEYAPNGLEVFKDSFSIEAWEGYILPVLSMPTMVVTLIPFTIAAIIAIILKLIHSEISFKLTKNHKGNDKTVYKNSKSSATKYKRK